MLRLLLVFLNGLGVNSPISFYHLDWPTVLKRICIAGNISLTILKQLNRIKHKVSKY
ncbi:hypothetical protein SRABI134_01220 [Peribacillus sp. Bi134]|nr:hypothetical protein SRABI134_01220 [Peribacillus sp. Bi134]